MMTAGEITQSGRRLFASLQSQGDADKRLWKRLRHHQLGVLFRRRQVLGSNRVDFYCPEAAMVVVIDVEPDDRGNEEDQRYRRFGLETLRFEESEILEDLDRVVVEIFRQVTLRTNSPAFQGHHS
ncbi:DUF559 domain-containing protein [Gammaproteobacteria bacterium AB-CW1]|uniref:DUF559 domain-containing protein n=1 Tax=Natronospira elongata TaxID=3110268 RepID=A0AAP6JD90_9GAMM|nr:DUF559 domain-containing protein [Gammaproteobacteria bacterium AB-CW1]